MKSYLYEHRVRYRECDPMGVVYHTHFLDYFEAARTEALRSMGVAYRTLEQEGIFMPVVDLAVRYHAPALYDDLLVIETSFPDRQPTTRIRIDYTVRRHPSESKLVTGHVTLCFLDREKGRPVSAPPAVLGALARFHESTPVR